MIVLRMAFSARTLPNTISRRPNNAPYNVRPRGAHNQENISPPTVHPPNRPQLRLSGGIQAQQQQPAVSLAPLVDEMRRLREDQQKGRDEVKKLSGQVAKLGEELRNLTSQVKKWTETSFTIESSIYKDGLVREAGTLYVKSLERQPSQQDVGHAILRVMPEDGRNRAKFNKAKSFVFNRLTDLRCEERRRVFGNKPCEGYPNFTTEEFADHFLPTVKVGNCENQRELYIKNLACLRKFAREVTDSKQDTFKRFRAWLEETYNGHSSEVQWGEIIQDDRQHNYGLVSDESHLPLTYVDNGGNQLFDRVMDSYEQPCYSEQVSTYGDSIELSDDQ